MGGYVCLPVSYASCDRGNSGSTTAQRYDITQPSRQENSLLNSTQPNSPRIETGFKMAPGAGALTPDRQCDPLYPKGGS